MRAAHLFPPPALTFAASAAGPSAAKRPHKPSLTRTRATSAALPGHDFPGKVGSKAAPRGRPEPRREACVSLATPQTSPRSILSAEVTPTRALRHLFQTHSATLIAAILGSKQIGPKCIFVKQDAFSKEGMGGG